MTRERQRDTPLGAFSEWHRETMPSWYKYIDIDYVGYIDSHRWSEYAYEPYVFIELIHVAKEGAWGGDVPSRYPLHDHKKQHYKRLQENSGVPVYVLWHPTDCDEFFVGRLGVEQTFAERMDDQDLASMLDHLRERRIKKLNRGRARLSHA